ncbi:MAG: cupredoxin domain-containing protein, partial [Nitrososphaerales archaeon]
MIVILHTDCTIIGLVSLLACAVTILPNAYAELPVWQVNITEGASRGGCENTFTCFEPAELYFIGDGIITWINRDTTVHTVMSNPEVDSPDPTISSNLIQPGEKFSYSFRQAGTWYYMCVIHPWMEGFVVIDEPPVRDAPSMVCASEKSEDGSIIVIARSTIPKAGEQLELLITFADDSGNYLEDVNWDFDVKQDGVGIFHETIAHGEI